MQTLTVKRLDQGHLQKCLGHSPALQQRAIRTASTIAFRNYVDMALPVHVFFFSWAFTIGCRPNNTCKSLPLNNQALTSPSVGINPRQTCLGRNRNRVACVSQASTLAKSYSNSLYYCLSELTHMYTGTKQDHIQTYSLKVTSLAVTNTQYTLSPTSPSSRTFHQLIHTYSQVLYLVVFFSDDKPSPWCLVALDSLLSSELQDDGGGWGGGVAARYAKHQICTNDEHSVSPPSSRQFPRKEHCQKSINISCLLTLFKLFLPALNAV